MKRTKKQHAGAAKKVKNTCSVNFIPLEVQVDRTTPAVPLAKIIDQSLLHKTGFRYDEVSHIWKGRDKNTGRYLIFSGVIKKVSKAFYREKEKTNPFNGGSSLALGIKTDQSCEKLINSGEYVSLIGDARKSVQIKTLRFFDKLAQFSITPVKAEFDAISETLKIGARIDVIGVQFSGSGKELCVIVERKTGYRYELERYQHTNKKTGTLKMKHPLSGIPDIAVNRHMLQLGIQKYILEKDYGLKIDAAFLSYVDAPDGCEMIPLADWFTSNVADIIKAII